MRNKMKKAIATLCLVGSMFALSACSTTEAGNTDTGSQVSSADGTFHQDQVK